MRRLSGLLVAACIATATFASAQESRLERPLVTPFSNGPEGGVPAGWTVVTPRNVKGPTDYTIVRQDGRMVLRARAAHAAAALVHQVRAEPAAELTMTWRWRVDQVIPQADLRRKEADDYPARVYVMFDYPLERLPLAEQMKIRVARLFHRGDVPTAALCYVWDAHAPAGTIAPSAYTDRVRMVVIESGVSRVKQWLDVSRDIGADFRRAFGEEPPPVSAVAVAADTDNTGADVTAYFGDISLEKRAVNR